MGFFLMGDRTLDRLERHWYLRQFPLYFERGFHKVRTFSFHHFYACNAKRPDVHFGAVSLASHSFWCHPPSRPNNGDPFFLLMGELSTEAKITWGENETLLKPYSIRKPRKRMSPCSENVLLNLARKVAVLFPQGCSQGNMELATKQNLHVSCSGFYLFTWSLRYWNSLPVKGTCINQSHSSHLFLEISLCMLQLCSQLTSGVCVQALHLGSWQSLQSSPTPHPGNAAPDQE